MLRRLVPTLADDRLPRLAALISAALALWAMVQSGSTHPDEVFQFLEPANHLAFGYGQMSWEWERGIRNWAVPGAMAGAMKLVHALGWTSPWGHRFGAALVVALLAYPGLLALLRYARRRLEPGEPVALVALVIVSWAPCLYFLGRTLGEPMGALLAFAGLEALDRDRIRTRDALLAGLWLGLAVVVRYAFAAFVVLVVLRELRARRWRVLLGMAVSGGLVAVALGLLDRATWGDAFHSMRAYLHVNLGKEAGDRFGHEPFWFYLRVAGWLPWPLLFGLPWLDLSRARALAPALAYLLVLSATDHKEGRFLFPVVLWLAADLAPSFVHAVRVLGNAGGRPRRWARLAIATFATASAIVYCALPWLGTALFRATIAAGQRPELTGLLVVDPAGYWGCAGAFYLGRDVHIAYGLPGEHEFEEALHTPSINLAIASGGEGQAALESAGFHSISAFRFDGTQLLERPADSHPP